MDTGGFGRLNGPNRPDNPGSVGPVGPRQINAGGPQNPAPPTYSGSPAQTTITAKPTFGQTNDPAGYGTPGAPPSSPLGEWQKWLDTMGPFLAQQPTSQPGAESGGLLSISPTPTNTAPADQGGMAGYYGPNTPWQGNRGFRSIFAG